MSVSGSCDLTHHCTDSLQVKFDWMENFHQVNSTTINRDHLRWNSAVPRKIFNHRHSICKNIVPHLPKILLASVHDILWSQAVDHVAGVKYNQKENHAKEQ